jgi:hypothetical protein
MNTKTAIYWIETYCVDGGKPVFLTDAERERIADLCEARTLKAPVLGRLACFVALLRLASSAARRRDEISFAVDVDAVWNAASERLQKELVRDGNRIVCRDLGTVYSRA